MKWSKVKKLVEDSFDASIKGRIRVYSTTYDCPCGRGWFTVDGEDIADLSTFASHNKYFYVYHEATNVNYPTHPAVPDDERTPGKLVEPGEFSRFDLHEACWEYLHSNVHESLRSNNPIVQSLAILSAKVGKNRLKTLAKEKLHPLARRFLLLRLEPEEKVGA